MPSALIVTTAGINCDRELARAFELAGAQPEFVHLKKLMTDPSMVDRFDLIGLPGGFSYGDAIAAGRIAAQLMRRTLYKAFVRAVERGVPIITPCNGFQMAVQIGLLPGPLPGHPWPQEPPTPEATLSDNASARFVDTWCAVEAPRETRCIWTQGLSMNEASALLPVAHAEGRFIPGSPDLIERLNADGQIAMRYAADDNPNGSTDNIAGICDASGLVFGLMPHPERYTRWTHHPWWTRLDESVMASEPPGLVMFRNAVRYAMSHAAAV